MNFIPLKSSSEKKNKILQKSFDHLYPDRITRFQQGGIDFVPDQRSGYRYQDVDGRDILDLHLNGGTFNLGHRNPELIKTLEDALQHWDIGNHHFASEPKSQLAEQLIKHAPGNMKYVVLTPSGSEAIDVAIKSARFATGRRKVVALEAGYHGRTGLSGAAGDNQAAVFFDSDYPQEFITVPFNDLDAMSSALLSKDVAIVLMETIPATAGFPMPDEHYLQSVKTLCEKYGTLYLADEVQTGLGRTGYPWAVDAWGVEPDMLVTGKGLSGGLYPMAALVISEKSGSWIKDNGWGHVSTFGGSDVGCMVALKALSMSLSQQTLDNVQTQATYLLEGLNTIKPRFPFFKEIRHKGLIMGLKFSDSTMAFGMMKALFENGIWAMVAGFDESVLQFKPGLLVDRAYCDEVLTRFENACIWLVKNINTLIFGGMPDESSDEIQAIKLLAQKSLHHWGMEDASLSLLKHRENTVYKVLAKDGTRYALRVHRSGYHTDAELNSELLWMKALDKEGIHTPDIIATMDQQLFITVAHSAVDQPRQCSLLDWVDGDAFDDLGKVEKGMQAELETRYFRLGKLASKLHKQSKHWQPPAEFTRQSWDNDGLLGEQPLWGRFWQHPCLTHKQQDTILKARLVLQSLLKQLGQDKSCYGLIHADFLPENILVDQQGELNLIDFDDCGYGWYLFEMATSLFPQADQPYFDELVSAYIKGYRIKGTLSDEHTELLPAFIMIRVFTYLGWLMSREGSIKNADRIAKKLAEALMEYIPQLLNHLTPLQRVGVEVLHLVNRFSRAITGKH